MNIWDNRKHEIAELLRLLMKLEVIEKAELKITLNSISVRRR